MENFRYKDVSKLVEETFTLQLSDVDGNPVSDGEGEIIETFEAPMIKCEQGACNGEQWEAFKVVFKVEPKQATPEHHYILKHDTLGEVCLYGSPNDAENLEFCCSYDRSKLSN
ncbi:DUF6916 family protein [Planctobacterium marinum]|uniref:DUF6916 family protein n=1 Tax=Planctobacterium marinum TaxID=1631968 RepID=UPI001E4AE15D|nr:hypothetical protein [Planctobacterium marinum]MCC2606362.1 hypothetical protein [Planctobacterium marinum]